ncbi:MAG: D-alanyl-D-alanine carboxypeptidase [Micavibrio sp.]|nr:D-alanyl-D-alanine carboxypeptidase [Micavibrio sp.]
MAAIRSSSVHSGRFFNLKRAFTFFLIIGLIMTALAVPAEAARHKVKRKAAPLPDRFAEIVIDAQTGFVLSEKNPDKRLFPASLTKLMTLYLTFEAIENGQLSKSQRLNISSNAEYQEPSKLGLKAGYTIKAEDAILAVVTKSANDAAVTLGEGVGGSESRFARLMTFKAQQLGMRNTHFANASGLHDVDNYSTARDMSILAQALMRDFPRYYRYFSTPSFTYAGVTALNHNKLLKTYEGCDGLKTGYVNASGYNLVASAVHDNKRIIGVVFGGRTSASRNKTMSDLLDAGFASLSDTRVVAQIQKRVDVAKGGMPRKKPGTGTAAGAIVSRSPVPTAAAVAATARTQTTADAAGLRPLNDVEEGDTGYVPDAPPAPAMPNILPAAAALTAAGQNPANNYDAAEASAFRPMGLNTTATANAGGIVAPSAPTIAMPTVAAPVAPVVPVAPVRMAMATPAPETTSAAVAGTWAVQVGAFSSHQAGVAALKRAASKLPAATTQKSKYVIAPLMTNRGMIYRARLGGLDRTAADKACKVLRNNCLVLTLQ